MGTRCCTDNGLLNTARESFDRVLTTDESSKEKRLISKMEKLARNNELCYTKADLKNVPSIRYTDNDRYCAVTGKRRQQPLQHRWYDNSF